MSTNPTRQPLRSLGQASQAPVAAPTHSIDGDTDVDEATGRPAVHHAVKPGGFFWLACRWKAVLLAHSREKEIPQDPAVNNGSTFRNPPLRALHRLGEHRLRALYEDVLFPRVVAIVQQSGLPWRTFGAYRQGWSAKAEASVPTLAVWCVPMGRPDASILLDAQRVADALDDLLLQHGLEDVHVEVAAQFRPEIVGVAYGSDDGKPSLAVYHPFLPGNSVGPRGATGSGTFSGYVRVQGSAATAVQGHGAGPEADVFGLTCHHVAALAQDDPMAALAHADNVQLSSPAAADHAEAVRMVEASLANTRKKIAEREADKEARAMMGKRWTSYLEADLDQAKKHAQQHQETVKYMTACWETETLLGRVLLSSGARMPPTGQSMEDWALVALNQRPLQQQEGGNSLPVHVFTQFYETARQICHDCRIDGVPQSTLDLLMDADACGEHNDEALPTVAELLALARQQEDATHVVLRGRTTLFGAGVLHDMRDGVRTLYGQTEVVSRELTALNVSVRSVHARHALSDKGDSGAPVRTTDGRLVGFVLASNRDEPGATTHIAVAATVADSIQKATGAERVSFVGRNKAVRDAK